MPQTDKKTRPKVPMMSDEELERENDPSVVSMKELRETIENAPPSLRTICGNDQDVRHYPMIAK